ncbi:MAG: 50S ribosomal protein L15 [Candidatus Omnitrophica bacterium]|nr:50S ribosomal protein L15 [Candidatus Omnitrophota bacterium]
MVLRIEHIGRPKGIKRRSKRVGRGIGSGRGKTAGRGSKGAKSRSGSKFIPGFEGGQMTLIRRLPKRGFTNKFKREWEIVNIEVLDKAEFINKGDVVDKTVLLSHKILRKENFPFKVLGKGVLNKALTVKANAFSEGAKAAIEKAGGKAEIVK